MKGKHLSIILAATMGLVLSRPASGNTIVSADVNIGDDVTLYLGDPADYTGVRAKNGREHSDLGTFNFKVEIEGVPLDANTEVEPGFRLLDTTLMQVRTIPDSDGQMRLRVRRAYDLGQLRPREIPGYLTLMRKRRKDVGTGYIWKRISRVMREKRYARTRRKIGSPQFDIGYYGVDTANDYVWAVVDMGGDYAVGIPEPATLGLLAAGGGLAVAAWRRNGARKR